MLCNTNRVNTNRFLPLVGMTSFLDRMDWDGELDGFAVKLAIPKIIIHMSFRTKRSEVRNL